MTNFYTLKERTPREDSVILLFDEEDKAVIAGKVEMTEYEEEFLDDDHEIRESLALIVFGNVIGKHLSEYSEDTRWCYLEEVLDDDVSDNTWLLDYI